MLVLPELAAAAEAAKVEAAEKLLSAAAAKQQTKADARLKTKIDELQVGHAAPWHLRIM